MNEMPLPQTSPHYTTFLPTVHSIQRFARFATVGLLGTFIDLVLFLVLRTWFSWPTLLANICSYSAGIVNNYLLHRAWTFRDRQRTAALLQFARFALVSLSALALNTLLVLLLAAPLGTLLTLPQWSELLAKACATVVGFGWNFVANRAWTFKQAAPQPCVIPEQAAQLYEISD